MNILMFVVFFLTDLAIVLGCKFAYGKKERYQQGMILGVHVPEEAADTEAVKSLCENYRKRGRIFQWSNLLLGCAVCFLCFFRFTAFLLVWMLWMAEYIAGLYYFILHYHREMYRLKIANGWIRSETARTVHVDTETSALSDRMPVSWKWHLPVLGIYCILAAVLMRTAPVSFPGFGADAGVGTGGGAAAGGSEAWLFLLIGAVEELFFFLLHLWLASRQNVVYSRDSKVNMAVNRLMKRRWTGGLAACGWIVCIFTVFVSAWLIRFGWLSETAMILYIFGQTVSAGAFLVPLLLALRKKAELLRSDRQPLCVDDDEFWKKGWYSNPDDRRLFVQDRMSDMNYSMNMAHPAAKAICGVTAALTAAALIGVLILLTIFDSAEVVLTSDGESARVSAALYKCEFRLSEVKSAELIQELPEDDFVRTNGGATEEYAIGHFRGRETGKCMMFLYTDCSPVLQIELEDQKVFINSRQEGQTERWYEELKAGLRRSSLSADPDERRPR